MNHRVHSREKINTKLNCSSTTPQLSTTSYTYHYKKRLPAMIAWIQSTWPNYMRHAWTQNPRSPPASYTHGACPGLFSWCTVQCRTNFNILCTCVQMKCETAALCYPPCICPPPACKAILGARDYNICHGYCRKQTLYFIFFDPAGKNVTDVAGNLVFLIRAHIAGLQQCWGGGGSVACHPHCSEPDSDQRPGQWEQQGSEWPAVLHTQSTTSWCDCTCLHSPHNCLTSAFALHYYTLSRTPYVTMNASFCIKHS